MNQKEIALHNRLYEEAVSIAHGKVLLEENNGALSPANLLKRLALAYSGWLFRRAIKLNPNNWQAMWFLGKISQRVGNEVEAQCWFNRAVKINSYQPDLLRELSISEMALGNCEEAIRVACDAARLKPTDRGLYANLGLAYLLANRLSDARDAVDQALKMDASDEVSLNLKAMLEYFATENIVPPKTTSRLLSEYTKAVRNRSRTNPARI